MKFLNNKSVVFGLLMLLLTGAFLGFTPKSAESFGPNNNQQDAVILNASDTDSTESEDDDDDEWEA